MDRLRRTLWRRGQAWRGALIVGAAFVLLGLALDSAGKMKDVAAVV